MKTLYVTDLDGTLLTSQKNISSYSEKIINDLIERGMFFTYATARSLSSASVVTKGLELKTPIVAYNGAHIFLPKTGERIASESFEKTEVVYVEHVLKKHGISPMVYSFVDNKETVSWVLGTETEGSKKYLDSRKNDKRMRGLGTEEKLYEGEVFYFTCIGEKEQFEKAYEVFLENDRYTCTLQAEPHKRDEYWLEIMPRKATKANAILKLKEILGCEKIVSFGDAMNDIPMFQISDECYAMENAVDELKAMATDVIGSNEKDGVAVWLNEHVKIVN